MRRWLFVSCSVALVAGCGRIGFERADGGASADASSDATTGDASFGNCWPAWTSGAVKLGNLRPLAELDTAFTEADPFLLPDGLTLYWVRSSAGIGEIMVARRPTRTAPFEVPAIAGDLDSAEDDGKVSIGAGGLRAVLSSRRTGSLGYDLWEAARASATAPFSTPTQAPFASLNNDSAQFDPLLTDDGLRLYYAPGMPGGQAVVVATRPTLADPFGGPVLIDGLLGNDTADPTLSPDELVIVYSARRNAGDPLNMFYASRSSSTAPFGDAQAVPDIASAMYDGDAHLSADGCELFFASDRAGGQDLYVAQVLQ